MVAHTALERRGRWTHRKFQAAKVTRVRLCLPSKERKTVPHVAQTVLNSLDS